MEESKLNKRSRDDSDEIDLPEVKRLRENLLDSFDDDVEFCSSTQDLDSFMKSFEEEIIASPSAPEVVDLTQDAGEARPELGYLLEASDDELGLPPTSSSPVLNELVRVESDSSELEREFWEVQIFDSFGIGFEETENLSGTSGEYNHPALDGLFDDSDLGFGWNGFPWRPETLPAQ